MTTNQDGKTRFGPWEWIAFASLLLTTGGGLVTGIVNGVRFVDRTEAHGDRIAENRVLIERERKVLKNHGQRIFTLEDKTGLPHLKQDEDE